MACTYIHTCIHAYLFLSIAEDDSLRDGEGVVQVAQRVELPLLPIHGHKKLLYALREGGE